MRKRLFIFAAATCFALSAFATPAFAGEPNLPEGPTISSEALVQSNGNSNENSDGNSDGNSNENSDGNSNGNAKKDAPPSGSDDGLPNGSDDGPTDDSSTVGGEQEKDNGNATPGASHDPVVGGSAGSAMTLAGTIAGQNVQAWIDTNPAASTGSATFTLDDDFTTDQGLLFTGDSAAPADSRQTFIIDAQSHNITLNGYGIGATYCNVIIKNCNTLTIKAHNHKVPGVFASACYFGHATLTLNNCTNVTIENDLEKGQGGSGISVYDEGSLYFQKNTNVTISGYMAENCSGIYMDRDDQNYDEICGSINVVNYSSLTVTKCFHNGITANPYDINVTDHSVLTVKNNGDSTKPYQHEGGIGCYFSTLTISEYSSVISEDNGVYYGVYTHNLKVDGTSNIKALNNGMFGVVLSGEGILSSGAKLIAEGNCDFGGAGVKTEKYDPDDEAYWGRLTVENGATLSSCGNYYPGFANEYMFTVSPSAHVYLNENLTTGLDNYPGATTTVEEKADFTITGNHGYGIKNGNSHTDFIGKPAILVLKSGLIAENNKTAGIPGYSDVPPLQNLGGGIYNENGHVTLYNTTKVYNNHAEVAGDDLYNANTEGNSFNIIALEPGAKWSVLDDDGCIIDDWYHDYAGEENRWKPATAKNNTVTILPLGAALKAAHGINAPTPSPKPAEPTAAPTEAPTPTAAPTTIPTVAPTAAPTTAPTAAPADNTATAAPATPAPTAQPTVTATPAPTAQASGVIPQTGDSSSPALFSILTLGSITALCVLQKRRKSK